MCLAIPGKVLQWIDDDPLLALAEVEFGGVTRRCHMACVPEARLGDYVVVHAGVAIAVLDEVEAGRVFAELASLPGEIEWPATDDDREMPP
jgi:hydrogenase expression/formation protein HypC